MPPIPRVLFVLCVAATGCSHRPDDSTRTLDAAVRSRPVVLLGEVHDNAAQHRLRAAALRALLASGARPALLMEQFDRERQADLDAALGAAGATPDSVIAAGTGGDATQGWSWDFYRPYLALAIAYRLQVVAANVSRIDTRGIVRDGLASQSFDADVPTDLRDAQARAIVDGHCGLIDTPLALRMSNAQVARDQFMARLLGQYRQGAVLLAGNGHVRKDIGAPRWMDADMRARSVSVGVLETDDANEAAFDVVVRTPAQARPDPCEGMRGSRRD